MMVYTWIRYTDTVMYRIDLAVVSSLYGLQSACVKHMRQCVSSRLRTVEYSRVSLQDAAKRCVVRLAHVAPLCVASVLSYKKVSKGSEFLSRPPSPLNG